MVSTTCLHTSVGSYEHGVGPPTVGTAEGDAIQGLQSAGQTARGFVAVTKSFIGRKPLTQASLTEDGRAAFVAYLDAMAGLLPAR